jgi:NTE family protein
MTLLVSDGGAPFGRSADIGTDPIRQLQRVLDVTDNQVRALRRRDLITRFQAATHLQPNQVDPMARFGTYWGIDTDPAKVAPTGALPCAGVTVSQLAGLGTRLSDLGETQSKELVNWGYAICDRCVRVHYNVPELQQKPAPQWPYPQVPLA